MTILWLVLVAVVLAGAQAAFFSRFGLARLTYQRQFSQRLVQEGEEVEMIEVLTNRKAFWVPWLRIESRMATGLHFGAQRNLDVTGDLFHTSVFFLMPFSRVRRRHKVQCLHRGYYPLCSITMTSGDLLGLHLTGEEMDLDCELLVYPKLLPKDSLSLPSSKWQGEAVVRRWIQPDPFLVNGIRDYQAGDSLRDVHWAATARTGNLQVKTHDFTADPKLWVLLNIQLTGRQWGEISPDQKELVEGGLRVAATLIDEGLKQGMEVGFATNAMQSGAPREQPVIQPQGAGGQQWRLLMETLARLRLTVRVFMPTFLDEFVSTRPSGQEFVIVTSYWDEALEQRAEALRHMGNEVHRLPYQGVRV